MGVREGGGSVVLDSPLKLWSLIDRFLCGSRRVHAKKLDTKKPPRGSEKLFELLKQPESWDNEEDAKRKEHVLEGLKNVSNKLQQPEVSVVIEAAAEVRKLTKDDPQARTTLALLGVIPPLVALLDAIDPTFCSQIAALYALLNLAIANDANKAAIVKGGAIHKMLKLIQSPYKQDIAEAVVANFLGLSALDSNKPIIGLSGAIPFLIETLRNPDNIVSSQAKQDSLRALYNLSISPSNVLAALDTDLIPYLLTKLGDMNMSDRILSILSNVVSVSEGRRAISSVPDTFPVLVDVLNWTDSPGCQEKACYILMVMAHKSYGDREAMIESGIVSALLELTLLGSTLSQKRASRILECLRVDKGKHVSGTISTATLSAPLCGPSNHGLKDEEEDNMMSQENKAIKQLVQQSLQNNMTRMVKRANLHRDFVPSDNFKSFTSKSLPF